MPAAKDPMMARSTSDRHFLACGALVHTMIYKDVRQRNSAKAPAKRPYTFCEVSCLAVEHPLATLAAFVGVPAANDPMTARSTSDGHFLVYGGLKHAFIIEASDVVIWPGSMHTSLRPHSVPTPQFVKVAAVASRPEGYLHFASRPEGYL